MKTKKHDEVLRIADLPYLSTRRACLLADCSRTTLARSGIVPVGKRGRTNFYATADILEWLRGGLVRDDRDKHGNAPRPRSASIGSSTNNLDRLRNIARYGAQR